LGYKDFAAGGLCSAAFLAWHAGREIDEIGRLVLINPQAFKWSPGASLEVGPLADQYDLKHYRASLQAGKSWRKLVRGGVDLTPIIRLLARWAHGASRARLYALRNALGFGRPDPGFWNELQVLQKKRAKVQFIFSANDPGVVALHEKVGSRLPALVRAGFVQYDVIDGPDHSFTPRWATNQLQRTIAAFLTPRRDASA
jgi:hypothetical protein